MDRVLLQASSVAVTDIVVFCILLRLLLIAFWVAGDKKVLTIGPRAGVT
jgi:hypothetical protein